MKQGYVPSLNGLPSIALTTSTNVTSTAYLYSDAFSVGTFAQGAVCIKATLGGGVTSVEFKIQQAFSADPSDDWFNVPLLDTANKTTVSNEFVSVIKPDVASITASTGTDGKLGPIPVFLALPYVRAAYKITGAGTANIGILIARVSV